jgi:hypothetical protein
MGRSEWGIHLRNQEDFNALLKLIDDHNQNEHKAEALDFYSVIHYNNKIFACVGNGGGRDATTNFIETYSYQFAQVYYPFDKPDDWWTTPTYLWKKMAREDKIPTNLWETVQTGTPI